MQHFLSIIILLLFLYFVSDVNELSRGAVIGITTGVSVFVVTIVIFVAVIVVLVLVICVMLKKEKTSKWFNRISDILDKLKNEPGIRDDIQKAITLLDKIQNELRISHDSENADDTDRLQRLTTSLQNTLTTAEDLLGLSKAVFLGTTASDEDTKTELRSQV